MSTTTKQAIDLMELLPEKDQNFALEFIKKLVIAWDPDYTKVTSAERAELERADKGHQYPLFAVKQIGRLLARLEQMHDIC